VHRTGGLIVWHFARWYLHHRLIHRETHRVRNALLIAAGAVVVAVILSRRKPSSPPPQTPQASPPPIGSDPAVGVTQ
jgi:hypothetical protein